MHRLSLIYILLIGYSLNAGDGSLDPTFGTNGKAVSMFGPFVDEQANAIVVRHDGVMVTGGFIISQGKTGLRFVSFTPTGQVIDATTEFVTDTSFDRITGLAVQPDNKVVAVGFSQETDSTSFIVARYNTDGTLDTSFNVQGTKPGIVVIDFFGVDIARAYAVAFKRDGRIVAVGEAQDTTPGVDVFYAAAMLNQDGTLDSSFANGMGRRIYGTDVIPQNTGASGARAVAIQSVGSTDNIVLAGFGQVGINGLSEKHFQIVRITCDGDLDTTFGPNLDGVDQVTFIVDVNEQANGVDIYPDSRIVAIGTSCIAANEQDIISTRRLRNGGPDTTYNGTGQAIFGEGPEAGFNGNAIAVQNDLKILIGGSYTDFITSEMGFFMLRYLSSGMLDLNFGIGGQVRTTFNDLATSSATAAALAIALQCDGKIVLAGGAQLDDNPSDIALARYLNENGNDEIIVAPTITTPESLSNCKTPQPVFSGAAQNPSNIAFYLDGSEIDRFITEGSKNEWVFIPESPLSNGKHTAQIVAEYKSGNLNCISDPVCCGVCLGEQSCLSDAVRDKYCSCVDLIS